MEELISAILTHKVELVKELLAKELKKIPTNNDAKINLELSKIQKIYLHEESIIDKTTQEYIAMFNRQRNEFGRFLKNRAANAITQDDKVKWSKLGYGFFLFICKYASENLFYLMIKYGGHLSCTDHWNLILILGDVKNGKSTTYNWLLNHQEIAAAEVNRLHLLHFYLESGMAEEEIVKKFLHLLEQM